ncbi:RNA 2',3'-cyclic phosphodiesterase [Lentibacillus lipolyticus]|nr:RNA 2',3'-cyclic phosphodiesterase [Lentibacillus lipolyticus]
MKMNLPHYFVGIPLPGNLKQILVETQSVLKSHLPYKQWTHPDDFHVTLKFLGPTAKENLDTLLEELKLLENVLAFNVCAGSLGTFGNPNNPRVLWGAVERKDELLYLHQLVESAAAQAGFQKENRAFKPHITLAKKWDGGKMDLQKWKEQYNSQHSFSVDQVVVYQIFPHQSPKYKPVRIFDLVKEES